jgi:Meiosis protein SPO22/ZIP4 like
MFNNASLSERDLDPNQAESVADLLFEMGRELLGKKHYEMAAKWLERAYSVINGQELDRLSADASELRTSIIQCSVKSLLSLQRIDATEKAKSLVMILESEVGDKLIVLLMKLELLSTANDVFDSASYGSVVQKIIRTVNLTDTTFKLILHHVRKLNDKSPALACKILDDFLRTRILQSEKMEFVETTLINRLWIATSHRDDLDLLSSLQEILEIIKSNVGKSIGASATYAAQMVECHALIC